MAVCDDAPADPGGRWHAKDHLAHLAWWRWRTARVIESAHTGGEPPPRTLEENDDVQNAAIYAETKDQSAEEIKRDASASWDALDAALRASSDDDLTKPHPNDPGAEAWEAVVGMGGHLGVHLMFWFMDDGDVAQGEAAARWGYDFEISLLPEGAKRADASYNLACFYARAGRLEEALPLLRDSLHDRPELLEWARKDPDLAGVRGDPRIEELVA